MSNQLKSSELICLKNRQADKTNILLSNSLSLIDYKVVNKDGIDYIVAPMTMIVEGVLNNFLYTKEEIAKNIEQWNGKPLPIGHPIDSQGRPLMANTPEAVEKYSVGQVWNVKYLEEDGLAKLNAEAWIDINRAEKLSPELLEKLKRNERIEVSTGLFTDAIIESGIFNNKSYDFIAFNFRADHLAILLDDTGACSNAQGCGLSLNQSSKLKLNLMKKTTQLKNFFASNELSFQQRRNQAESELLRSINLANGEFLSVHTMFENNFIFEVWGNDQHTLFKISYHVNENDDVILDDQPQRVKEVSEFVSVETERMSIILNVDTNKQTTPKKGESKMEELVDKLINNSATPYNESMRVGLLAMNEEDLKSLLPEEPKTNAKHDCDCGGTPKKVSTNEETEKKEIASPTVNGSDEVKVLTELVTNLAKTVKSIPEMITNAVAETKKADQREPLIETLLSFNCEIPKVELEKMTVNTLQLLVKSATGHDFFGIASEGGSDGDMKVNSNEAPDMPELYPAKKEG